MSASRLLIYRRFLAGYMGFVLPMIAIACALNPSGQPPSTPFSTPLQIIVLCLVSWGITIATNYLPRLGHSLVSMGVQVLFLWSASIFCALTIHRDFFSACFPIGILVLTGVLLDPARFFGARLERTQRSTLFVLALVVFTLGAMWEMVVAYTLVVRLEPRWAEATIYNVYNAGALAFLFYATLRLRFKDERRLVLSAGSISIDGIEISGILDQAEVGILRFLARSANLDGSCHRLLAELQIEKSSAEKCANCVESDLKVSACANFRVLYNHVLRIRKVLEAFRIGTIVNPDRRSGPKAAGWRLELEPGVRVDLTGNV